MAFCNDVKNIITLIDYCFRLVRLNKEYRQVFWFFDNSYNYECPNLCGRCVARYLNAKVHWLNGQFHRIDNPAFKDANGDKFWYYEGKLHRPTNERQRIAKTFQALEFQEHKKTLGNIKVPKIKEPVFNWQSVRPAIEYANGDKLWYYEGKLHRPTNEGPAIEYANGDKFWYYEGKLHRPTNEGPAIEYANGYKAWYYEGNFLRSNQFE